MKKINFCKATTIILIINVNHRNIFSDYSLLSAVISMV